jgi:hypothetical protein
VPRRHQPRIVPSALSLRLRWPIVFRWADSTADVMIAKDFAGTDNHEVRSLWLLVRSPNSQDIHHRMVQRLPRDAGIQALMMGSPLAPAVPVLIVSLQDADKIGHAGLIPVFGHNRNLSIGRGLAPLPNPQ